MDFVAPVFGKTICDSFDKPLRQMTDIYAPTYLPLREGRNLRSKFRGGVMPSSRKSESRAKSKRDFARALRQSASNAERKLWKLLRGKEMGGLRFRRQQPIGPYIVDFYCPAAKLVVELDGGQHGEDKSVAYDMARTRWLEECGYRVLRFSNSDFLRQPANILENIWHAIEESGCPLPEKSSGFFDPPSRGG